MYASDERAPAGDRLVPAGRAFTHERCRGISWRRARASFDW